MPKALNEAQVAAYRERGILFPLPALDAGDRGLPRRAGAHRGAARAERGRVLKNKSHLVSSRSALSASRDPRCGRGRDRPGPPGLGRSFFNKAGGSPTS